MRWSKSEAQPFGHGVVAEPSLLHRQVRRGESEVLGVAGLVEERPPVVDAADRLDDEHDAVGNLDRGTERARRLLLTRLDVELDVRLGADVDSEAGQRRLERGHHPVGRELAIPFGRPEQARDVPALGLVERDAEPLAKEGLDRLDEQALRVGEDGAALRGEIVELEAEAAVELDRVWRAEVAHGLERLRCGFAVHRVQVLLGQLVARVLECAPLVPVGLVRHRRPEHAEAHGLAAHARLERRLERRDLLCVGLRQVPEVLAAGEVPQLAHARVPVHRLAE